MVWSSGVSSPETSAICSSRTAASSPFAVAGPSSPPAWTRSTMSRLTLSSANGFRQSGQFDGDSVDRHVRQKMWPQLRNRVRQSQFRSTREWSIRTRSRTGRSQAWSSGSRRGRRRSARPGGRLASCGKIVGLGRAGEGEVVSRAPARAACLFRAGGR
jgi:hypothetical protein